MGLFFKKSSKEADKIGLITLGAVVSAVVLFAIADYFIRARVPQERNPGSTIWHEAFWDDVFLLQAVLTCGIPTILGAIQVEVINIYDKSQK